MESDSGGLDAGTRQTLERLASLIKSQVKASEEAKEAAAFSAKREEDEAKAREALTPRSVSDQIVKESLSRETYPAVQRVQSCLLEAARRRGAKAYDKAA